MTTFVNLTGHDITYVHADGREETFPAELPKLDVPTIENPCNYGPAGYLAISRSMGGVRVPDHGDVWLIVSSMVIDAARLRCDPQLGRLVAPDTGKTAIRYEDGPRKGQVRAVTRWVVA